MKARPVTHNYVGPVGENYVDARATRWRPACSCGWSGPARVNRLRCKDDHAEHVERERVELLQDIEWDRAAGGDL